MAAGRQNARRTENEEKTMRLSGKAAVFFIAAALSALCVPAATAATNRPPKTKEEQLTYLEGALAEALHDQDWGMLKLAAKGLKELGLKGAPLEAAVARGEAKAAMMRLPTYKRARLTTWSLAARAKTGDAKAYQALQSWADKPIIFAPGPDWRKFKNKSAEFRAAQKKYNDYRLAVDEKDQALFCLAMLKDPGAMEKTLAELRKAADNKKDPQTAIRSLRILVPAVLAAEPQKGRQALMDLLCNANDKTVTDYFRWEVLSQLADIAGKQGSDTAFDFGKNIAAKLPKNFQKQLLKPFTMLVKRYEYREPKPGTRTGFFTDTGYKILLLARKLPLDAEAVAALQGMKEKFTGRRAKWRRRYVDSVLQSIQKRKENQGGKRPKPPVKGKKKPARPNTNAEDF